MPRVYRLLAPWMVLPLGVASELGGVEVHLPQVARRVPLRLVVEVRRAGMAALSPRRDRSSPHAVAELDHRHEAVAAGAVPLPRPRPRSRRERRQRAPR